MAALGATTGVDGIIAGGNTPSWLIQEAAIPEPLTEHTTSIPLSLLTDAATAKIDCYMNMDGIDVKRTPTTKERQRMCEKVKQSVKTGETIDVEITAIYDQQSEAAAEINVAYTALPEGATVYLVRAYGLDSTVVPTTANRVDIVRGTVQQRNKNNPVAEEDLMFTATLSGDLMVQDVQLSA